MLKRTNIVEIRENWLSCRKPIQNTYLNTTKQVVLQNVVIKSKWYNLSWNYEKQAELSESKW
jgi:hypothetical protein